ncbi:ferredoxin--NADP+ reductase [Cyclonatronum proteinivorum]|uniref:Ferredoxin--NADP+ reductase n=1 Tax=Cyclonatronum proteinivorum TaxID=1457365 RepID=A0A345UL31_9BACT|nr:hypothetical protein [Cyclonatronum proteinivorum]AXJ01183.1 ferredoxin--NADP+ reductase [Cyclonatronum proteinivorum]
MPTLTRITIPQVDLNICNKNNAVEVPILASRIATSGASPNIIRHITFDLTGTPLEGRFRAGQSIGVLPPGTDEKGKPNAMRLYSISSPSTGEDGAGRHHSTTVKRVIAEHWNTQQLFTGLCSNYLSSLRPGDTVKVAGPSGKRFLLPENLHDFNYVFFATGTGIAPFRGMIMDLMQAGFKGNIALIFGSPYRTDLLYERYFLELAAENAGFHYLPTISREDPRPDGSRPYVQCQLIDRADLLDPMLRQDNTLIYICGLKGMETGIIKGLIHQNHTDYLRIKNPAALTQLPDEDLKKSVKPGDRMFLEVY